MCLVFRLHGKFLGGEKRLFSFPSMFMQPSLLLIAGGKEQRRSEVLEVRDHINIITYKSYLKCEKNPCSTKD